ncbi:MAG TPA: metallophosphoesterase family protein [Gaiellaceae bacterium]|jgi:diadenosine tetraphosphatase ApaH/serine/threonine PP2A family protein phosphatase|nr:metallophosphoesterase family protein [Gaiellaceae bacterium]
MRVAVVSDIHSNLHALDAVLEAIDTEAPDELWCLGDLVGYGPRPNECCAAIAARATVCLAGNHDLAVQGTIDLEEFHGDAAVAAWWTRDVLDAPSKELLDRLGPEATVHGVSLYHGSARDPIWEYVLGDEAALATIELAGTPLVLVGHSHVALRVVQSDDDLTGGVAPAGTELDLADARALLNPGSVGQPRDGDPRAAFLVLDLEARHASFHRVEYDVERTQREMREAGLPELLAARLALGL